MNIKINKYYQFILCLAGPLVVGSISGIATASGVNTWFQTLYKPAFNPPAFLFGPVWTLLYMLMGVSCYLIIRSPASPLRQKAIVIFLIQLVLNFAWSFLFFKFHLLGFAFLEILLIWLSILAMILSFYKISRTAAWLQVPYLLWVSFASVLNGAFWWLN